MENKYKDFNGLLKRIAVLNVIFVFILTLTSFIFLISYEPHLLKETAKSDILKAFFSNIRFSLSALAYINLSVFILLSLFPLFNTVQISKFSTVFLKIYYCLFFLGIFFIQFAYQILSRTALLYKEPEADLIAQTIAIFMSFKENNLLVLAGLLLCIIASIAVFFIYFLNFLIPHENYRISDKKKSLIITLAAILLCAVLAKGKISGVLCFEDSRMTGNEKINEYAINAGLHKAAYDIKRFNVSNVRKYMMDHDSLMGKFKEFDVIEDDNLFDNASGYAKEMGKEIKKLADLK
ncbi:MAG: hypothetical protein FWD54_05025 [Endomicrobia bacterium]|nr:hypothetical protein [Endomicrobiia bacterium]